MRSLTKWTMSLLCRSSFGRPVHGHGRWHARWRATTGVSLTVKVPQIQVIALIEDLPVSSKVVDISVVAQRQFPLVQLSIEILQLQYIDKVIDVSVVQVQQVRVQSVRRQSRTHGQGCCMPVVWSMSWGSSSTVVDVPVIMQRRWFATVEVPQVQFIAGVGGHSSSQQRRARRFMAAM